jgi:hypothetical protein
MNQTRMKTAWVVWVYMIAYLAMLILQLIVEFAMPLDGATYGLFLVVGGYVGMDEFATFVASKRLPAGIKYTGSYPKLLAIVVGMFLITTAAVIVQAHIPETELPLDQIVLAAGLVAGLFAGGNKAANAAEKSGPEVPA